ncbi:pilus assembly protein [Acinetobacter sp. YH16053]|uniref:pilus assembly protein n=1 Tax=Acinetobacter sp. YH16053 TaxID=2601192 RepID=UPI0015D1243E|nr:PilC/PilY family type IV pilus protein [Acinetobacter sp. YH16053]
MKTIYKKLTVAVHAAIMTSLICSALPTFASDVELYKAPQSSETTIMFMMDVSGSMNFCDNGSSTPSASLCTGSRKTRLDLLKEGMTNLLLGNIEKGIEPLPDKLFVGLSEFGHYTGRIKLEAKSLGSSDNLGVKEVYRIVVPSTYSGTRTQTKNSERVFIRTRDLLATETQTRTREQTRQRTQRANGNWNNWSRWSSWSSWSSWSNWSNGVYTGTWGSWNNPSWSETSTTATSPSVAVIRGEERVQQCVEWNAPTDSSNLSCKTWENSTLLPEQVSGNYTLNTNIDNNYTFSNWAATNSWQEISSQTGGTSTSTTTPYQQGSTTTTTEDSAVIPSLCGNGCQKETIIRTATQTRTMKKVETEQRTDTKSEQRTQTATAVADQIKTYTGTAYDTHRNKMVRAVKALSAANGTPTAFAYAEVGAYMLGKTTKDINYISGFSSSNGQTNIQNGDRYLAPTSVTSSKQCNTQGIYFLTDGVPEYSYNVSARAIMRKSLGDDSSFSCSNTYLGKKSNYYDSGDNDVTNWQCIGDYANRLATGTTNQPKIKTAVVGFGDYMSGTVTNSDYVNDIADAQKWGEIGGGGFYRGSNDQAIVDSVLAFLKKLQKYIPPVTTGSVTVPVDNLDTQNIQPWGYFPQFDPQPDSRVTTWIGNLKKYEVKNNILRDRDNNKVVDEETGVSVDDPNDFWADTSIKKIITKIKIVDGKEVEEDIEVRVGGALSQLKLGLTDTNIERKIFTDRKINEDGTVATVGDNSDLLQVKTADLKVQNDTNNFVKDPKRGYLAALFGYDISSAMAKQLETSPSSGMAQTTFANFLTNTNATLRQMGAVMHSKPLLITQEGKTKFDAATGDLSYESRDDLIVFGTTQGLLHVVRAGKNSTDSDAGKEVFTFVPSEMIEKQHQGFLDQKQQGIDLKYGIDGPWTAYTEYATRSGTSATAPVVSVKNGKQWLYGGLRMGGRSYYALDLSDVTSTSGTPKIKFKIDPQSAAAYSPLSYMGQSWSKPTLTWVKWKGERKLVMLVGGGYDDAYENLNHRPSSSKDKGAGVYMFDADDGSLLWWASSNVDTTTVDATQVADMKRSVVSQIKAIDRNNDGLTDHLYFGDLGGQLWRVDIDSSNTAGDSSNFAKRVVRILDMSSVSNVPRFYSTPSFSIHSSGNGFFGVVTIGSGNLSFPMSESDQNDALYVIYDKDVTKRNLFVLKDSELSTVDINSEGTDTKQLVENTDGNTSTPLTKGGWYYPLATKNRILNDNVVIDNDLYTSVFDATVDIDDVNCYGGVRGKSVAKQFCLPYGQCLKKNNDGNYEKESLPEDIELGLGNIGISFGGIDKKRGLVLNLPTDKPLKSYQGKTKFISQRWYER